MTLQDGQDGVPTNRIYENEGLNVATGECREASAHDGARWITIMDNRAEKAGGSLEVLAALSVPMALRLATRILQAIEKEVDREDVTDVNDV